MLRPAAALALSLVLAACGGGSSGPTCPGERVAPFHFTGTRVPAGDPALADLDPSPAAPDCEPAVGYGDFGTKLPEFDAVLTRDPVTPAAALCTSRGVQLFGERTGARYVVETGTTGAVLGACAETCGAGMRLVVAGDVRTSAEGEALSFAGVLVETMGALDGSACGTCTLPCEARYLVEGAR